MKKIIGKRCLLAVLLLTLGCFFIYIPTIGAQKLTHTVEKGDTLWSICEKHYGDPDLWPKLWQMNPFITNPHLLNSGDVITLFEKELEKIAKAPEEKKPPVKIKKPEPRITGINIDDLIDVRTIGYLSYGMIKPWGTIFAKESAGIILSEGDIAFVTFDKSKEIKPGDEFSIFKPSPLIKHPLTGKGLGNTFSVHGKLVVEEAVGLYFRDGKPHNKTNVYRSKVIDAFGPVHVNDPVISYQPISPCVLPVSINKEILGNIVAAKDQQQLISKHSIVYIDKGLNHGVQRGNIFEVANINIVNDPEPEDKKYYGWQYKLILPDVVIGKIMVLESRPETSTALVISTKEGLSIGSYIKDLSWKETPEVLSNMAHCPIE
ncbi:MAG: LysM peptidoglycan-binding domain-containing protein [Deltaproteobacteria bacterium]|nr:LysM peptidoglycan-binding domain-containing protein [Deltaproteobacteria bacterium]